MPEIIILGIPDLICKSELLADTDYLHILYDDFNLAHKKPL